MTEREQRAAPASLAARRGGRCPICGKPTVAEQRPFCSARCRDVDLSRWLGGVYRIPVGVPDEEDSAAPPASEEREAEDGR